MYVTEAMIQSMEEMMRNASIDMEKSLEMMMELKEECTVLNWIDVKMQEICGQNYDAMANVIK